MSSTHWIYEAYKDGKRLEIHEYFGSWGLMVAGDGRGIYTPGLDELKQRAKQILGTEVTEAIPVIRRRSRKYPNRGWVQP